MSSENNVDQVRSFTARTDGNNFNFKAKTFHHLQHEQLRIELQVSGADQVIYCYDRLTANNKNFDADLGLNCLKKLYTSKTLA